MLRKPRVLISLKRDDINQPGIIIKENFNIKIFMSTEYTTSMLYEDLIKTQTVEIEESKQTLYFVPHKILYKNKKFLYIIKEDNGLATIIRQGSNDVLEIFCSLIKEFPHLKIFNTEFQTFWEEDECTD